MTRDSTSPSTGLERKSTVTEGAVTVEMNRQKCTHIIASFGSTADHDVQGVHECLQRFGKDLFTKSNPFIYNIRCFACK